MPTHAGGEPGPDRPTDADFQRQIDAHIELDEVMHRLASMESGDSGASDLLERHAALTAEIIEWDERFLADTIDDTEG